MEKKIEINGKTFFYNSSFNINYGCYYNQLTRSFEIGPFFIIRMIEFAFQDGYFVDSNRNCGQRIDFSDLQIHEDIIIDALSFENGPFSVGSFFIKTLQKERTHDRSSFRANVSPGCDEIFDKILSITRKGDSEIKRKPPGKFTELLEAKQSA